MSVSSIGVDELASSSNEDDNGEKGGQRSTKELIDKGTSPT